MDMPQEQAQDRPAFVGWIVRRGQPPAFVDCTPQPALLSRRLADHALHQMTPAEIADDGSQK